MTKVPIIKAMVFPVVMYGCEIWTTKKTEHQRIDAFKLWCWRRYLKVPWTADQSILKKINPEYLLEWLMLKLKLQYFGHLMQRADSLMLGKTEGRRKGWQRMRWLDGNVSGYEFKQTLGGGEGQASLVCSPWGHKESDMTEWPNNNSNFMNLNVCTLTSPQKSPYETKSIQKLILRHQGL